MTAQRVLQVLLQPITGVTRLTGSCHHAKNSTLYVLSSSKAALKLTTPQTTAWVQSIPTPCQAQPMGSHGVLPLAAIGVLLSPARTGRGVRVSTSGVSTPAPGPTTSTCIRCGLFDPAPRHAPSERSCSRHSIRVTSSQVPNLRPTSRSVPTV